MFSRKQVEEKPQAPEFQELFEKTLESFEARARFLIRAFELGRGVVLPIETVTFVINESLNRGDGMGQQTADSLLQLLMASGVDRLKQIGRLYQSALDEARQLQRNIKRSEFKLADSFDSAFDTAADVRSAVEICRAGLHFEKGADLAFRMARQLNDRSLLQLGIDLYADRYAFLRQNHWAALHDRRLDPESKRFETQTYEEIYRKAAWTEKTSKALAAAGESKRAVALASVVAADHRPTYIDQALDFALKRVPQLVGREVLQTLLLESGRYHDAAKIETDPHIQAFIRRLYQMTA